MNGQQNSLLIARIALEWCPPVVCKKILSFAYFFPCRHKPLHQKKKINRYTPWFLRLRCILISYPDHSRFGDVEIWPWEI